jgi:hypothetical protein
MDTEALQAMDEQADKIIGRWSFAALGANILPPPFDMIAVGSVFAGMGSRIASIYGVQINRTVLRDLGVAIAKGCGAVLAGYYVGTGLLKYIPGMNVWVALLVQPPVVGAVAYAAGHAFKQYYHGVITEGRELTAAEVGELAKKVLDEKLNFLRGSGYRFRRQERAIQPTSKQPLETRPYEERQLILLAGKFSWKTYASGQLLALGDHLTSLRFVAHEGLENVAFPPGHPRNKTLYVGHPLKPRIYYLAAEFHHRLFEHKVTEISRMLRHLGANHIRIERLEGYSSTGKLAATLGALGQDVKGNGEYHHASDSSIMFEEYFSGATRPELPTDMVWFDHEDFWREIAEGRLKHGTRKFNLDIEYKNDFGINANLSRSIELLKMKLELGGTFTDFQKTVWHISGEFGEV